MATNLRVEVRRGVSALRESIGDHGLWTTAGLVASTAAGQVAFPVIRARRRRARFTFRGTALPYAVHRYNNAYRNERTVEIAVARWFLAGAGPGRTLEVGNVLGHYGVTGHTVLDKYETVPGVISSDIVGFRPDEPFDTVLAISTLEHVGWDEQPRTPEKVIKAIEATRACVAPGGRLLVTLPIGWNTRLDEELRAGTIGFQRETWLVRTSAANDWQETDRDEALRAQYGHPFRNANALLIGTETR